jgi:hypothetical protein
MHVLNAAASNICGFHWRETCILSPWLNRPVWNNRVYPPRKHTVQEVFLSKLSQFLKRNNVLDVLESNTNGFLWRDTYISSSQLNKTISNRDYLHLEKSNLQEDYLSKTNYVHRGKQCDRYF